MHCTSPTNSLVKIVLVVLLPFFPHISNSSFNFAIFKAESGVVSQEEERVAETGEAVEHELVTNDEEAAEQTSILEDADSFEPISDSAAAEALNEAADNNLVKSTVADDEVETVIDTDTNKEDPSKESEAENELLNTAMDSEVDQFVVHVDESDTNLDYDLGDKAEERDAPTPTKDESMDVDASDIVQSEEHSASVTVTATSQAEKSEATSSTPTSATKRFVSCSCLSFFIKVFNAHVRCLVLGFLKQVVENMDA